MNESSDDTHFKNDIKTVLNHFANLFDLSIYLINHKMEPIIGGTYSRPPNYFCNLLHEKLDKMPVCLASDEVGRKKSDEKKGTESYYCHAGLFESISPIYDNSGTVQLYVFIGQGRTTQTYSKDIRKEWIQKYGSAKELDAAFRRVPFYSEKKIESILLFFNFLVNYIKSINDVHVRKDFIFNAIINYINSKIDRPVSLIETASYVNRSISTVTHLIKKRSGNSFKQMLIEIKLLKAEEIMRSAPEKTIKEIAGLVGYNDQLYFSRIYKKYRKISPLEFRKQRP